MIPELQGGGAERVASLIGNYYVDRGENVFYFLGKGVQKPAYRVRGKVINTEISSGATSMISLIYAAWVMRKYKRRYKISVSISFMEEFNYINVLSRGKDKVITRICTILSQREELKGQFLYQEKLIRYFYNHSDRVVVMTDYAKNEMINKYRINRKKLVKIPNPVIRLDPVQIEKEWRYGTNTVISVGRLEDVKQHNVAIRVFSKVVEKVPNAKLVILGTGPDYNKLKKLISKLKLDNNVFLLGFQKDVAFYLEHSRVFLMTSKTEGFPNSMLEAMSVGVPVVSTDNPAAREILGDTGPYINHSYLWNEPITVEENILAEMVIKMLTDESMNKQYADISQIKARTYQLDKIMNRWNKIII